MRELATPNDCLRYSLLPLATALPGRFQGSVPRVFNIVPGPGVESVGMRILSVNTEGEFGMKEIERRRSEKWRNGKRCIVRSWYKYVPKGENG